MKALVTFLLMFLTTLCFAAPSVVINAGSILCTNGAAVVIDNGDLIIEDTDGFVSTNNIPNVTTSPAVFYGPEGSSDALTITPAASMGNVTVTNYSGQRHPNATTNKIERWWSISTTASTSSTIVFRVRTANDCFGYLLTNLRPYRWNGLAWDLISAYATAPTVSTNGQFSDLTFTSINFSGKKENGSKSDYYVTLGSKDGETLPVELSSFTAIATPQNFVQLDWTTQSETNVSGYYIFRNNANNLGTAERLNAFIPATNTSQETEYSFTDREATTGVTWYYWLQHIEMSGEFEFHGPINVTLLNNTNSNPIIPLVTNLQQVYPNPFNPRTTITFGLAKASNLNLVIYNSKGQTVRTLFAGNKSAGNFRIGWEGINDNGKALPSGIYYVKMTAGKQQSIQKIVLLK
jgi:hypothetical protein